MIMIEAKNLSKNYPIKNGLWQKPLLLKAVQDISFNVKQGQTMAIVGESGCGKSTLARMLTMIDPPSSGHLTINGVDIANMPANQMQEMRKTIQCVFQNPFASLNPRQKISDILTEILEIHQIGTAQSRMEQAMNMLQRVGLKPEHAGRYPHMFSGGQRQRIAIARALMIKPKILVLDEPVSALDMSIQAQILNLLKDLQSEFNLTMVFISHSLSVVQFLADEVMVMYLGHLVEQGPTAQTFAQPHHPYTRALIQATPSVQDIGGGHKNIILGEIPSPINPPSGCVFHPRCPNATAQCRTEKPLFHGNIACFNPN